MEARPQASGAEALGCSVTVSKAGQPGYEGGWGTPDRPHGLGSTECMGLSQEGSRGARRSRWPAQLSRSTQGCYDFTFQKESQKDWDWGKANLTSQGHP